MSQSRLVSIGFGSWGKSGTGADCRAPCASPLKDAHAALEAGVQAAYGFSAKKDLLAQLLALNNALTAGA